MNNQARLRVMFDRYNLSSKATKNFINYFMSNAELCLSCNNNIINWRTDSFNNISSHEGNNYEFVIDDEVNGTYPTADHESDETFEFNTSVRFNCADDKYDGYIVQIYNHSDGNICIRLYSNAAAAANSKYIFSYLVNKSRWTSEKLSEMFPTGLPDGIDVNNLKDFEPLLINEDFVSDDYITPVRKIKDYITLSGDSFDIEALGDSSNKLELTLAGGKVPITEDNVSIVMGSLSNSETGESLDIDMEMFNLQKVDDESYKLVIKSDKEFDSADLIVYTFVNLNEGDRYGTIAQKYVSYISGYNLQIPLQKNGKYKTENKPLWYAAADKEHSIGVRFCNLKLGNLDTDQVRLEMEKVDIGDDKPRTDIKFYLNDVFRAGASGGSKELVSINNDSIWPATAALVAFNRDRLENSKVRMTLYKEDGETIINNNAAFSEIAELYNYNGAIGHFLLDLEDGNTLALNFEKKADNHLTIHDLTDTLAMVSTKDLEKEIDSGIHIFNRQPWDRYFSVLEKSNQDISIPARIQITSLTGDDVTDVQPYNMGLTAFIELSKPKNKPEYSHKTETFTITTPNNSDGYDITNAYYKIGFYAIDGTDKSSEELAKSFIDKACLTVHYRNIYGTEGYKYERCFYVKPRPEHLNDDTFYSVSDMLITKDKSSPIIMGDHIANNHYNICRTALLPIIEYSSDESEHTLHGLMYMDLYNADDETAIDTDWIYSKRAIISVNGEDALDNATILITKI